MLTAGITKLVSVQTNPKIDLELNLGSHSLMSLGSSERASINMNLFKEFGRYVTRLDLMIFGDETYLLEPQYHLPNLKTFYVLSSPSIQDYGKFSIPSPEKCLIFEDLLVCYGRGLKTLEVLGVWQINISGSKFYPLDSLETVNLTDSMSGTLQCLLTISGHYISTLELYDVLGEANGELCYLKNLKHLHIDSDEMGFFELVQRNAKNLESLVFYCEERQLDFFPQDLNEFDHLKLLEVNCPVLNNAILQKCTNTLEYLYVPDEEMPNTWNEINLNLPVELPILKDLCVPGSKRRSVNMIKKNCASLEYLIIFGFKELDEFLEGSEEEDIGDDDELHPADNGIIPNGANPIFGNGIIPVGAFPQPIGNGVIANAANPFGNAMAPFGNQNNPDGAQIMAQMNQLIADEIHHFGNNDDNMDDDHDVSDDEHLGDEIHPFGNNDDIMDDDHGVSDDEHSDDDAENILMGNGVNFADVDSEDENGVTEYCWPDLVTMNCIFPNLKMLLLPNCTDTHIVESLAAKCPADVVVLTDQKLVGEAVKARIRQTYSYTSYEQMMHPDLSRLFQFNQ